MFAHPFAMFAEVITVCRASLHRGIANRHVHRGGSPSVHRPFAVTIRLPSVRSHRPFAIRSPSVCSRHPFAVCSPSVCRGIAGRPFAERDRHSPRLAEGIANRSFLEGRPSSRSQNPRREPSAAQNFAGDLVVLDHRIFSAQDVS